MNRHFRMRNVTRIVGLITGLGLSAASGAGLISGQYHFEVTYPSICLNGVYPLAIGDMETGCSLDASLGAGGNITGTLDVRTVRGPISGTHQAAGGKLVLELATNGQDVTQTPSQVQAELVG